MIAWIAKGFNCLCPLLISSFPYTLLWHFRKPIFAWPRNDLVEETFLYFRQIWFLSETQNCYVLISKHCCSGQRSLAFLSCWAVMRLRETPSHEQSRTLRCWALLRGAAGALTRTFWFPCSCLSRETINVTNPQDWHIFGETIFQMSNLS